MIKAPWTPAQIMALNRFQAYGFVHPFTCPNNHVGDRTLVATRAGWVCRYCDYTQDWAHAQMLDALTNPFANVASGTNQGS